MFKCIPYQILADISILKFKYNENKRKHSSSMHTTHFCSSGGDLPNSPRCRLPWMQILQIQTPLDACFPWMLTSTPDADRQTLVITLPCPKLCLWEEISVIFPIDILLMVMNLVIVVRHPGLVQSADPDPDPCNGRRKEVNPVYLAIPLIFTDFQHCTWLKQTSFGKSVNIRAILRYILEKFQHS